MQPWCSVKILKPRWPWIWSAKTYRFDWGVSDIPIGPDGWVAGDYNMVFSFGIFDAVMLILAGSYALSAYITYKGYTTQTSHSTSNSARLNKRSRSNTARVPCCDLASSSSSSRTRSRESENGSAGGSNEVAATLYCTWYVNALYACVVCDACVLYDPYV